jgi:hypothetical protein
MYITYREYRLILFLIAAFTSDDQPIYLKINEDVEPYWILQDPAVVLVGALNRHAKLDFCGCQ